MKNRKRKGCEHMAQRFKIDCKRVDDRRTLNAILAQNGYAVLWG